jgi:hypothetical protein
MFGWTRIVALVAVAAALAIASGVAGATSKPGSVPAAGSHLSSAGKGQASSAAARRSALLKTANLRTRAGAMKYLRAIGLKARHVVIQRGSQNYAGANCPGTGWKCTSTAYPVIQIASAGGGNTFQCATASCAVVQVADASSKPNSGTCIKTSGLGQSCSISQTGGGPNKAVVYENTGKSTGLTQTASSTASITQLATGANTNTACVTQVVNLDGSTNLSGKKGASVNVGLEAHQTLTINQTSDANGSNTAVRGATASGGCDPGTDPNSPTYVLNQTQALSSTVTGTGSITQKENAANNGANLTLNITQNQNAGTGTLGTNTATFNQTNSLTAIANGPGTASLPVSQTQSSVNGGILAAVNQSGPGVSTASPTQTETQCEDAAASGLTSCSTTEHASPGLASLTQTQFGPIRKAPGDSSQTGNSADSFTVTQNSRQDSDVGSTQSNVVEGGYHTDGTGSVTQTTTVNGQQTTNVQTGQDVSASTNCEGTSCTTSSNTNVLIVGNGDVGNTEPNDNLAQLLTSAGYSVTESANLPADLSSFGQVWWVGTTPPTSDEQNQLIGFAESGKGVFLTGERPCCEDLNSADQSIVNSVVIGGGITVGGQGDVCNLCNSPLPVNPDVVGNVATQPFNVTTWQPAAPGGMANVPDADVFSYYQPGDPSTRQVVAAVWDRSSVVGNGRLAVFMDINWTEAAWRAANWSDVAQNVAFFLSGLSSPPSP